MQFPAAETPLLGKKQSTGPTQSKMVAKGPRAAPPQGAIPPTQPPSKTAGLKRIIRAQPQNRGLEDQDKPPVVEKWTGRLSIYCVCTSFNIAGLFKFFRDYRDRRSRTAYGVRRLGQDVVHVRRAMEDEPINGEDGGDLDAAWWAGVEDYRNRAAEIFFFSYGVVCTWGLSEGAEWNILELLEPFKEQAFNPPDEREKFDFAYDSSDRFGGQLLQITQDVILLSETLEPGSEELVRAKLAVSYGMAQSAKLATFETSVDAIFDRVGHYPIIMARTGHLKLTDKEILKLSGELLAYSAYINLQTDVLDTPDWFWDNESYEPLYEKVARYLDVRHRVEVVNQRLGVLSEMYSLFRDERHILYGHRLEWIVIWLIVAEIVLDLLEIAILLITGK